MNNLEWRDVSSEETRSLRDVFGSFMTGVTVVTAWDSEGIPRGFTANSFTSVSLDPALVLVCIAKNSNSLPVYSAAENFAINVLGEWQRDLSNTFAGRGADKFEGVQLLKETAAPCLANSLSVMCCKRQQCVDAGDHLIIIGEVTKYASTAGSPLGYFRGSYIDFSIGNQAIQTDLKSAVKVGCLISHDDGLILVKAPNDLRWSVPGLFWRNGVGQRDIIAQVFKKAGLQGDVSFVYSIFEEGDDGYTKLFYRGDSISDNVPSGQDTGWEVKVFHEEDAPWNLVDGEYTISMVHRFFKEREADAFGIYCDTADGGRIAGIAGKPVNWMEWGN
ncbi:flavin reductase family protein [Pseudomonas sp. 14P_8.1_Bac3]|uniref:flavin reductase family protein n=1 Tax=Pseudomonas sp. 14P_8.1_Bac3 TaxID=2971621 RepID=UPI0021C6E14E|nr:flavin reductase family protein [Pseudomonas sp. 14P_8.1_Bac3]MCU1763147.1 flavin reductase family protein [Pseudomonas sp. 14P_8.1_Bac3]